ncbi:plasmid mobilization relaxosome protein MobC [Oscillatoria amoena NRMC-F 0135]|nr:plasmid mobilization relaxosome protein MobC [Oscillatoria amoena NRMC-F 0135]
MPRPTKDETEKQNTVLPPIRCTADEKSKINKKAEQSGLSLSEYVRTIALNGKIIIKQSLIEFTYLDQLRKIGVNINQQTRQLNATGLIPEDLPRLWGKLEELMDKLMEKK